jgi:hypothetical protein
MPANESVTATLDLPADGGSRLVERLEATRADVHAFRRVQRLLTTILVVLLLAGILAAADWLWILNTAIRAGGLLLLAGVAILYLARGFRSRRKFGRPDAAVEVETAFPQLGQRVRTTLEYSEPTAATMPAAPGLVAALATDADSRTRGLDFRGLVPWRRLRCFGAALAGIVALFTVLLITNQELRTAALRLLLLPVNYTQLEVKPGDHSVKVGGELTIQATLTGRPVKTAELQYRSASNGDEWTKLALDTDADDKKLLGTLETTLQNCQDDLEYRIVAGPVDSPIYHVTVLHPLALEQIEATVQPPAYTRKPAATVKEGNLKVIAGSRVGLQITLDRAPQAASLLIHPVKTKEKPAADSTVALQVNGAVLTGEIPAIAKELEYEITAEAADGMKLDANRFRIDVTPDRKPTVRFVKPREQIEVTPSTEVHMRIEAEDDFGLSKTGIVYQVGNGPQKTLFLEQDPKQPATLRAEAVLPLEDHEINFQDGVTYYAFTEDNHPDQPQRATTELQFIDIRPYKREYQMLDGGGGC